MKNKIEDLRNHLFSTLEALSDKDDPMALDRAKSIASVAQTLINSAKVEVDFLRVVGGEGSGFIPEMDRTPKALEQPKKCK
jgi:hypothetical protein